MTGSVSMNLCGRNYYPSHLSQALLERFNSVSIKRISCDPIIVLFPFGFELVNSINYYCRSSVGTLGLWAFIEFFIIPTINSIKA